MLFLYNFGPKIRREFPNGLTLTEFIQKRFGQTILKLSLFLILFYLIIFLIAEVTAIAFLLNYISKIPLWVTAGLTLIICLLYILRGGFKLSIITDKYQFIFIMCIILFSLILVFNNLNLTSYETIKINSDKVNKQRETLDASFHPIIRNDVCCYKSSSKVIDLAKKYSSDLHVLHLTTEKEIELFENIELKNKKITCEVCVHHLWFDERDYDKQGNFIVCNPAIKKVSDRDALRKALKEGYIDYVATDHAPHSFEDKKLPYGKAPAGIPLIEHSFHMMIELHKQGHYSLQEVISYMSHKVADRFSILDRGYVREGYKADLMMFDLSKKTLVKNETEKTKCGWTPFDGQTFNSSIMGTIINGKPVVVDGKLIADSSSAEQIFFDR